MELSKNMHNAYIQITIHIAIVRPAARMKKSPIPHHRLMRHRKIALPMSQTNDIKIRNMFILCHRVYKKQIA